MNISCGANLDPCQPQGRRGLQSLTVTRGGPNITISDGYDRSDIWPTPNPSRNISVPLMHIHTDGPANTGSDHLLAAGSYMSFPCHVRALTKRQGKKKTTNSSSNDKRAYRISLSLIRILQFLSRMTKSRFIS